MRLKKLSCLCQTCVSLSMWYLKSCFGALFNYFYEPIINIIFIYSLKMKFTETHSIDYRSIFSILKSSELFSDMNFARQDEIEEHERITLFKGYDATRYQTETVVLPDTDNQQYFIILSGDIKIKKIYPQQQLGCLKVGKYFINNNQNRHYIISKGSLIFKLNFQVISNRIKHLSTLIAQAHLLSKALPLKNPDMRFLKMLCKDAQPKIYSKGEQVIRSNQAYVYFILKGCCEIIKDNMVLCDLENCMFGEEILFQQNYEYKIRVKSAKSTVFNITKQLLTTKLSNHTLKQIEKLYQQKHAYRTKISQIKNSARDIKINKQIQTYQNNKMNKALSQVKLKIDINNNEVRPFFTPFTSKWKHEVIRSQMQNSELELEISHRLKTEDREELQQLGKQSKSQSLIRDQRRTTTALNLKRVLKTERSQPQITHFNQPIKPGYRFNNLFTKKTYHLSSSPQKINSILDIEQNITKRQRLLKKLNPKDQILYNHMDQSNKIVKRKKLLLERKYMYMFSNQKKAHSLLMFNTSRKNSTTKI